MGAIRWQAPAVPAPGENGPERTCWGGQPKTGRHGPERKYSGELGVDLRLRRARIYHPPAGTRPTTLKPKSVSPGRFGKSSGYNSLLFALAFGARLRYRARQRQERERERQSHQILQIAAEHFDERIGYWLEHVACFPHGSAEVSPE